MQLPLHFAGFGGLGIIGFRFGTAPTQKQSILGVLLRAIYNHIILIIQLLLRGGSTQGLGCRDVGV